MKPIALLSLFVMLATPGSVFADPFDNLDKDKDGKLSSGELPPALRRNLAAVDKNNDGELSDVGFMGRLFSGFQKEKGELQNFNANYAEELKSFNAVDRLHDVVSSILKRMPQQVANGA